jgi:hypothetical protein
MEKIYTTTQESKGTQDKTLEELKELKSKGWKERHLRIEREKERASVLLDLQYLNLIPMPLNKWYFHSVCPYCGKTMRNDFPIIFLSEKKKNYHWLKCKHCNYEYIRGIKVC